MHLAFKSQVYLLKPGPWHLKLYVGGSQLTHRRRAAGDSVCFWFPTWPGVGISICLTLSIHYSTAQWITRPFVSGCCGGESGIPLHSFALFWLMCDDKHLPSLFPDFTPNLNNKQLYYSGAATWGLEYLHVQTVLKKNSSLKYVELTCIFNIYTYS